jgi:hypothetical protein
MHHCLQSQNEAVNAALEAGSSAAQDSRGLQQSQPPSNTKAPVFMPGMIVCGGFGLLLLAAGLALLVGRRRVMRVRAEKCAERQERRPSIGKTLAEVQVPLDPDVQTSTSSQGSKRSEDSKREPATGARGISLQESWEIVQSRDFLQAQVRLIFECL